MATLKQRLHRKNASGTYDTVYFETSADLITGTVPVNHGGTGRATLTSGYFLRGNGTGALTMTAPSSVRSAIGAAATSHTHTISQVTNLQTEINNLKTSVSNGKAQIASAITDKGVSTSASASFSTMASNIQKIGSGGQGYYFEVSIPIGPSGTNNYTFNHTANIGFTPNVFMAINRYNSGTVRSNAILLYIYAYAASGFTITETRGSYALVCEDMGSGNDYLDNGGCYIVWGSNLLTVRGIDTQQSWPNGTRTSTMSCVLAAI